MIADQPKPPSGLPLTINLNIPAYWTPEQALAVFELLDDLRDQKRVDDGSHAPLRPFPRIANFSVRFLIKASPLSGRPNYRCGVSTVNRSPALNGGSMIQTSPRRAGGRCTP
jgi:hypothetical protein